MKCLKQLQKHWITCWLITALVVFLGVGGALVYGAYIGNSDIKRSVSTKSISDIVFSSNVLKAPPQSKNLHDSNSTAEYYYDVTVCNFEQMSPTNHAKEKIIYNLTAELVRYNGTSYEPVTQILYREDGKTKKVFQVKKTGDDNKTVESITTYDLNGGASGNVFKQEFKNESLSDEESLTDTFTLVFDREEMKKDTSEYFIQVTATPSEDTVVSGTIREIKAWISVSKGKVYGSNWTGVLLENDNADAYNMQLSGSGRGTIEIMWKKDSFSITDMFLMDSTNEFVDENGNEVKGDIAIITSGEWSKLILKVDSYTKVNKYDIQFFKKQSHTYSESDLASNYIKTGDYRETTQ